MFQLLKETPLGRRGRLSTAHGTIESPFFMPVGTAGAMKGIEHRELVELGAQVLLCNTYHLHVRPGETLVEEAGGLHRFIGWERPILTDSGGFQVFSLRGISKITDDGVHFQSHVDGAPLFIGPEESMRIQHALGSDIIMCFDECPPSTAPRQKQIEAVERTIAWANRCKTEHEKQCAARNSQSLLFGIVQGGLEIDLRIMCAEKLIEIGFDGYAVGGLAVGETEEEMFKILEAVLPILPADKPRYLMGVGRIDQVKKAVELGIDMFDCVLPMREARHGRVFLSDGQQIKMDGAAYLHDHSVIDADSPSLLSRQHTKSYLSYLLRIGERYGETIACMQNLGVTIKAMQELREKMDNE
jgi:queuine tRNA-ribosyltransferase